MRTHLVVIILMLTFISSCEKTVTFDLNEQEHVIVVDASIEDGRPPMVILSKSFGYFSKISPEILLNSFIHGAEITISDGSRSERLKEYSYTIVDTNKVYYYTADSSSPNGLFRGALNKAYSLEIKVGGKVFTANTTIPALTKKLDTLWWKKPPFTTDTTKALLMTRVTDPPGLGNYIRYFTKVDNGPFLPGI